MSKDVFKDLGFSPDQSADLKLRSDLIDSLLKIIEKKGYSQKELVRVLGIAQPHVSDLMKGKISKFSSDKLVSFLAKLNSTVTVKVSMPRKKVAVA